MKLVTVKGIDGTLERVVVDSYSTGPASIVADGYLLLEDTHGVPHAFFMPIWSISVEDYIPPAE